MENVSRLLRYVFRFFELPNANFDSSRGFISAVKLFVLNR